MRHNARTMSAIFITIPVGSFTDLNSLVIVFFCKSEILKNVKDE